MDLATETAKYVFPKRFQTSNLEEALMSGITIVIVIVNIITFYFICHLLNVICSSGP